MPLTVQPTLRAIQEANEAASLIQTRDDVGVTIKKAQESGGQQPKQVPKLKGIYAGTAAPYVPS